MANVLARALACGPLAGVRHVIRHLLVRRLLGQLIRGLGSVGLLGSHEALIRVYPAEWGQNDKCEPTTG